VRHGWVRGLGPGTGDARTYGMRDVRLFILGHIALVVVAVLGSI
jgi:hypothetical protein